MQEILLKFNTSNNLVHKKNKNIITLLLTSALVLFSIVTNAQEVSVVDKKGTIVTVNNNLVNTSATEETPADYITANPTYTPIENDTYIYIPANGEKVYYVYDGAAWNMIAPTKASRVFYPPSIAIDANAISLVLTAPGDETKDLYQEYSDQFTLADTSTSTSSTGAPTTIPTYLRSELYYYVTYYDKDIFDNVSVDADGVMTYDIKSLPLDDNTIINVVFVVK
jgi:hypothetical protein